MLLLSPSSLIRFTGSLVLLAVAVLLSPRPAAAECGSHVTMLNGLGVSEPATLPYTAHQVPKAPCHGPGCSNSPSTPLTPLPAPVSSAPEAKACVLALADDAPSDSDGGFPRSTDGDPVHQPNSIFHPPRA